MKILLPLFILLAIANVDFETGLIIPIFELDQVHSWEFVYGASTNRTPLDPIQQFTLFIYGYTEAVFLSSIIATILYTIIVHFSVVALRAACCDYFVKKIPILLLYLPFLDPLNLYYSLVLGKDLYSTAVGLLSTALIMKAVSAMRAIRRNRAILLILACLLLNLVAFAHWRIQFFMLNTAFLALVMFLFWFGRLFKGSLLFGVGLLFSIHFVLLSNPEQFGSIFFPAAEYIQLDHKSGTFQFPDSWAALLLSAFGLIPTLVMQSSITAAEQFYFVFRYGAFMFLVVFALTRAADPLPKVLISAGLLFPVLTSPWYINILVSERHLISLKIVVVIICLIVISRRGTRGLGSEM